MLFIPVKTNLAINYKSNNKKFIKVVYLYINFYIG